MQNIKDRLLKLLDVEQMYSVSKHYCSPITFKSKVDKRIDCCVSVIDAMDEQSQTEFLKAIEETVARVDRSRIQMRIAKHILRYPGTYDENFDYWAGKNSIAGKVVKLYNPEPCLRIHCSVWGLMLCPDFAFLMDAYFPKERILEILKDYVDNGGV